MDTQSPSAGDLVVKAITAVWKLITHPDLGTLASIGGLIISAYVLWTVRDIKQRLIFFARVPQIIEQLEENASAISRLMTDIAGSMPQLQVELERCNANLDSLKTKVKGDLRAKLDALTSKIAQPPTSANEMWAVYIGLNGVIQALRNFSDDYRMD